MQRVPVIILGGFLGSGKTTLLLHLYEQAKKKKMKPGMLINELGDQDTDGNIMDQDGENQLTLLEGCVCCTKKSEIVRCFEQLLHMQPDVIFVELTGVANPIEVSKEFNKRELISKIYVNKMITVLDTEHFFDHFERFVADKALIRTLKEQLVFADAILLNKTDLIDDEHLNKVREKVHQINESAQLFSTEYSVIDTDVVFDGMMNVHDQPVHHKQDRSANGHELSFDSISTVSIPVPISVSEGAITDFFSQLGSTLIRAKGYMNKDGQVYLMQFAGNRMMWSLAPNFHGDTYLTLIGIDLNAREVYTLFNQQLSTEGK